MYKLYFLLFLAFALPGTSFVWAEGKPMAGWVEQVKIYPGGVEVHAKLDTGADTSSLNASDIIEFERNGDKWVRFTVQDRYGNKHSWEREILRTVRIKRSGKSSQIRDVIQGGVCLGKNYMMTPLTLVDRSNYNYQMLLGRAYLAAFVAVDPSVTFVTTPSCKIPEEK